MAKKLETKPTSNSIPKLWNISQLAIALGWERRTVAEKLHAARTKFEDGPRNSKLYHLADVIESLTMPPQATAPDPGTEIGNLIQQEELKMVRAKREKAEIDLNIRRGEYMPVAVILDGISTEYSTVRKLVMAMPSRLARQLAVITDAEEVNRVLTETVDEILEELKSDSLKELEKYSDGVQVNEAGENDGTAESPSDKAPESQSTDTQTKTSTESS